MKKTFFFASVATLMLTITALSARAAGSYADLYGDAVEPSAASRTIAIDPNTSYVNVSRGDTVKFLVGDKTFAWRFDGAGTISEVDLNNIAPANLIDHTVKVYIKRTPMYDGA
jgi:hypothetical protein